MSGAGAVVALPLKAATEVMASRFHREHARIQSHPRRRLDGAGGDACVHHRELSMSGVEEEGTADAACDER